MKRFVLYTLLVLLLSHSMSQVIIVADFIYNQDFIAQNLCENIEKPILKCNGKCQLAKELEQNEEKQPQQTIPKIEVSIFIAADKPAAINCESIFYQTRDFPNPETERTLIGALSSVFHPPCC